MVSASQDTYIKEGSGNFGTDNDLKVRSDNGGDERSLIQFDLTGVPAGSTITGATLYLYQENEKTGTTISLYRVTGAWNALVVTWLTAPTFDPGVVGSFLDSGGNNCIRAVHLSPTLVQGWVDLPVNNNGVLLIATGTTGSINFTSRNDGTSSRWPQLSVTYTSGMLRRAVFADRAPERTPQKTKLPVESPTATATPTATSTVTTTATGTSTTTATPTGTATSTATASPTGTATPTGTAISIEAPSSPTPTATASATLTVTPEAEPPIVPSAAATFTATHTAGAAPLTPTGSATPFVTGTAGSPSPLPPATEDPSASPTATPTLLPTSSPVPAQPPQPTGAPTNPLTPSPDSAETAVFASTALPRPTSSGLVAPGISFARHVPNMERSARPADLQ